jgi:hypothetical protein
MDEAKQTELSLREKLTACVTSEKEYLVKEAASQFSM